MIGKIITELRDERGMTQNDLAIKLNRKRETINQWEKETRDIKTMDIIALANFFDVPTDYLLGISSSRSENATERKFSELTGLNGEAFKNLAEWKHLQDVMSIDNLPLIANTLLTEKQLLKLLYAYLFMNFDEDLNLVSKHNDIRDVLTIDKEESHGTIIYLIQKELEKLRKKYSHTERR